MFNFYFITSIIVFLFILKMDDKFIEDLGLNMVKNGVIKEHVITYCLDCCCRGLQLQVILFIKIGIRDKSKGLLFEDEKENDLSEIITIIIFLFREIGNLYVWVL